jgi:hypothetical protein
MMHVANTLPKEESGGLLLELVSDVPLNTGKDTEKVNFTPEQAMNAHSESKGIDLLYL